MTRILHEDLRTFMIKSRSILLKKKNFRQNWRANRNRFLFNNTFSENRAVNETMRKKVFRTGQTTDDNMTYACWITKATDTNSEYVTLIGLLLQQWLHEHSQTFHCNYFACLVTFDSVTVSGQLT
jgi:hypothetical protein